MYWWLGVEWVNGRRSLAPAGSLKHAGQRNAPLVLVVHAQVAGVFSRVLVCLLGQLHDDVAVLGPVVDGFDDGTRLGAFLFVEPGAFVFDAGEFFAAGAGAGGEGEDSNEGEGNDGVHELHGWSRWFAGMVGSVAAFTGSV